MAKLGDPRPMLLVHLKRFKSYYKLCLATVYLGCRLTVHSQKLGKSGLKLRKYRLLQGRAQVPVSATDETMKNVLSSRGNLAKTGSSQYS